MTKELIFIIHSLIHDKALILFPILDLKFIDSNFVALFLV